MTIIQSTQKTKNNNKEKTSINYNFVINNRLIKENMPPLKKNHIYNDIYSQKFSQIQASKYFLKNGCIEETIKGTLPLTDLYVGDAINITDADNFEIYDSIYEIQIRPFIITRIERIYKNNIALMKIEATRWVY